MQHVRMLFVSCVLASSICAGCSSMQNGVFAIEGTGVVYDHEQAESPTAGTTFDSKDVDVRGYGLKGAFNTPVIDIVGTIERRKFDDESATEVSAGVRKRFFDVSRLQPYVEGRLLRGGGLETTSGHRENYAGIALGGGILFNLTDHLFLDGNLEWEGTSSIDVGPDDTRLHGAIGRVGIGFSF
jgi:hypothetical protein